MRRPYDLAAVALALTACLVLVEAQWRPPLVSPAQAGDHIGERVRVQGMVMDLRHFDAGGRMVLVADGAGLHVRLADTGGVVERAWVEAEGVLRRDGGLPLLEAEAVHVAAMPDGRGVALSQVAADPLRHVDALVHVEGRVAGPWLEDGGHRVRLVGETESGPQRVAGVLHYDASCLCFAFHVPWSP